jgi:hypothetical protein
VGYTCNFDNAPPKLREAFYSLVGMRWRYWNEDVNIQDLQMATMKCAPLREANSSMRRLLPMRRRPWQDTSEGVSFSQSSANSPSCSARPKNMIILFGHRAYQPFGMNDDTINTGLCQHNFGLEIANSRFQARNVAPLVRLTWCLSP